MKLYALLVFLSALLLPQFSYGDIVAYRLSGFVQAELENVVTPLTDTLSGDVDAATLILHGPASSDTENSITTSTLDYAWDGTTLSGFGFIDEEKTFAGKKGGLHRGESTLTFDFTIDETSNYVLTGNFGYVGITAAGEADTVSWTITGTNYFASGTASTSSSTTVHDQLWGVGGSFSDTILAGDYTLVLTADFHETVNNETSREAGWEIQSFTVTEVTVVPEPSSLIVLAVVSLVALPRRRSR